MKIVLVSTRLPPVHDGIGDYTARLAEALGQQGVDVRVWTQNDGVESDGIDGVNIAQPFTLSRQRRVWGILEEMERAEAAGDLPGAIVLQFNQFSWGRWGLNFHLPRVMQAIKKRWPEVKLGVMFHEKIVPRVGWKFRVMRLWQLWQYNALADVADVRFFSIQKWADEELARRPDRPPQDSVHLPVGSNLPYCPPEKAKTRAELGLPEDAVVCGVFGTAHPSRLLTWVGAAVAELRRRGHDAWLLYIGGDGDEVRRQCREGGGGVETPIVDTGRLPAAEAAACFHVMDLYLSPFIDGVSTRRGSAMAALQHGVAVVSTRGELTDDCWTAFKGAAESDVSAGHAAYSQYVSKLWEHVRTGKVALTPGRRAYEEMFSPRNAAIKIKTLMMRPEQPLMIQETPLAATRSGSMAHP